MCYRNPAVLAIQQAIPIGCPAKALAPSQRLTMGLQALAGTHTVTGLADEHEVSRKFVFQQAATAQAALDDAFAAPAVDDDQVLFQLPVIKSWLRQVALGLTLTWALRLLEAQDRGLAPQATIAEFGAGIRAGQKLALPGTG